MNKEEIKQQVSESIDRVGEHVWILHYEEIRKFYIKEARTNITAKEVKKSFAINKLDFSCVTVFYGCLASGKHAGMDMTVHSVFSSKQELLDTLAKEAE